MIKDTLGESIQSTFVLHTVMIKFVATVFYSQLQGFALIVSSISHDIDHRGTNNRFQSCTNSDLFQLYNTQESILEVHTS